MSSDEAIFERTPSGKIGKFNFFQVPLIWVEGDDDVVFFGKAFTVPCRIEPAYGRKACEALAKEIKESNFPFAVVMDSDYDALEGIDSKHDRIMYLDRYAFENYLLEQGMLKAVCQNYVGSQNPIENFDTHFSSMIAEICDCLEELVVLDIANCRAGTGAKSFPENCMEFYDPKSLKVKHERVGHFQETALRALNGKACDDVRVAVNKFAAANGLPSLLRGHFVFSLIRHFLIFILRSLGIKPQIDNRGLLMMLSAELWHNPPTAAHARLRVALDEIAAKTKTARDTYRAGSGGVGMGFSFA